MCLEHLERSARFCMKLSGDGTSALSKTLVDTILDLGASLLATSLLGASCSLSLCLTGAHASSEATNWRGQLAAIWGHQNQTNLSRLLQLVDHWCLNGKSLQDLIHLDGLLHLLDHRCLKVLLIVHVNHLVNGFNLQDYDNLLHLLY